MTILVCFTILLFIFGHIDSKKANIKINENNIVINKLQIKIKDQLKPLIDYFNYQNLFALLSNHWKSLHFHHSFTVKRQEQMQDVFDTLCNYSSRLSNDNDAKKSICFKKI